MSALDLGSSGTARADSSATCRRWICRSSAKASTAGTRQHEAHHRAHLEVLLADHLLVGVGGQHVELPADHLGNAEVGNHKREDDERRRDQAVAHPRQRHGPEHAPARRAHGGGRLVQPPVRQRQGRDQDHQRVREAVEHLRQHDADGAVDGGAHQPTFQEALVAEDIDQRDGRQQRRREQRQHGECDERRLGRHARARERVGVDEGQRHDEDRRQRRHPGCCSTTRPPASAWRSSGRSWQGRRSRRRRPGSSSTAAWRAGRRWPAAGTPPARGWPRA